MTMRCSSIYCHGEHQEHRRVTKYPNFAHTSYTNGKAYRCLKCGRTEPRDPGKLFAQELATQIESHKSGVGNNNDIFSMVP